MDYLKSIARSLNLGFPFIVVTTSDYPETIKLIAEKIGDTRGLLHWDMPRGALGLNEKGMEGSQKMNANSDGESQEPSMTTAKFEECMQRALDLLPNQCVILMDDVHLLLAVDDEAVRALYIQSIRNCREAFKSTERAVIFLVPSIQLPMELTNDVEIIECPLPNAELLAAKAVEVSKAADAPVPNEEQTAKVCDSMLGLSMFAAESSMTKCLSKARGFDFDALWEKKKAYIRQVPCLAVPSTTSSFELLGGLHSIKDYGRQIIGGQLRPRLVVLLDEIDKWIASLGDSNGINADALGQLLGAIQDNNWDGITLPGFAGTGKTEWAKALGNEAGGLFLSMDLGGAKGGIVGDSEKMIRQALSMIKAMGDERVMFVATCNDMKILETKPELLRRLAYGIHFFDLPTAEEQAPIWEIWRKRYSIEDTKLPECVGWTGAEIKKVCKLAWEFGLPLSEVAGRITPVCKTMGDGVKTLRAQAEKGNWLSATSGKPYTSSMQKFSPTAARKIAGGNN